MHISNRYGLKWSVTKSIEFAISQCKDQYLFIVSSYIQKIDELQKYKTEKQQQSKMQHDEIQNQINELQQKHNTQIKQLKLKHEKLIRKTIEKTKKETEEELKKEFDETVKSRARKAMSQIRDGQQKTIKSLNKKIHEMQS